MLHPCALACVRVCCAMRACVRACLFAFGETMVGVCAKPSLPVEPGTGITDLVLINSVRHESLSIARMVSCDRTFCAALTCSLEMCCLSCKARPISITTKYASVLCCFCVDADELDEPQHVAQYRQEQGARGLLRDYLLVHLEQVLLYVPRSSHSMKESPSCFR